MVRKRLGKDEIGELFTVQRTSVRRNLVYFNICTTIFRVYIYRMIFFYIKSHAVSRSQQVRQWEASVKTFRFSLAAELCVRWRNSTPRLVSTLERRNENINLNKYFIYLEWGSNPQVVFTVKIVTLRHDRPVELITT